VGRDKEREASQKCIKRHVGERGEGGMHGHNLNVGLPVSVQPADLIHEYRL